ncbi:MAG: hypothetical protein CL931_03360 [Deltaproteobacteria bacterium]|nr:hypothetical protein [Deltaproteobacteria bacterium]
MDRIATRSLAWRPRGRLLIPALAIVFCVLLMPLMASGTSVRVPLDLDDDPTTGCSVELADPSSSTGSFEFQGAEITVFFEVDRLPAVPVTANARFENCPEIDLAPVSVPLASGLPGAIDLGYRGSDAFLVRVPLAELGESGRIRFAVEATSNSGSSDVLIEAGGTPLSFDLSELTVSVPGLGASGLFLLLLCLFSGSLWLRRSRAAALTWIALASLLGPLLLEAGPAGSSGSFVDQFGPENALAFDDQGDSKFGEPATDLFAVWGLLEGNELALRFDFADVALDRCRNTNVSGDPECDGVCDGDDDPSSPDCDAVCSAGEPGSSLDCDGLCGPVDAPGSIDCEGLCEAGDAATGSDCDGSCAAGDASAGPDCDGVCSLGLDDLDGADCDAQFCTPADPGPGAPGCDGACVLSSEVGSSDCDGLCSGVDTQATDCDGVCDPGDVAGGLDCNGFCDADDDPEGADCDDVCQATDHVDSPDCEGVCDFYDDAAGPDCESTRCTTARPEACNGTCEWREGGSADCNGICEAFDWVRSADCDGVCDPGAESAEWSLTADCNGWCSVFESATSSDCDGVCDQFDEGGSPDCPAPSCNAFWSPVCGAQCSMSSPGLCNGVCGSGDTGSDCNGACEPGDFLRSEDCDGWCQSYDAADSPDCDGACGTQEVASSPDCDGVCALGDSPFGPDCDEICDPGEAGSAPDCARDVTLWLTSDAVIEEVWIAYGLLDYAEGVWGPASWSNTPSPHLVPADPHVFSLVEQPHTLSIRLRDDGSGRALMAAVVDVDGTVLARTGTAITRVTSVAPGAGWFLPGFDDSSWTPATTCTHVEAGWEDSGGGFRSVSDAYGAERVWEGDTCGVDDSSSLWIRLDF